MTRSSKPVGLTLVFLILIAVAPTAVSDGRTYIGANDCFLTKQCVLPLCREASVIGVVCFQGGHIKANALGQAGISIDDGLGGVIAGFACQSTTLTCGSSGSLAKPFCRTTILGNGDGWNPNRDLYVFIGSAAATQLTCAVTATSTIGTVNHT